LKKKVKQTTETQETVMVIKRTATNTSRKDPRLNVHKIMPTAILLAKCVWL